MSLLWPDQLLIALSPNRISIIHRRGWLHRYKLLAQEKLEVSPVQNGEIAWQPALNKLAEWLATHPSRHAKAKIVLSAAFVRYSLLPANETPLKTDEQTRLMKFHFEKIFGTQAKRWVFAGDSPQLDFSTPIAAVDEDLLLSLRKLFYGSDIKLDSVQTHLMATFNYWSKRLIGNNEWFVSAEQSRVTLANISQGHWQILHQEATQTTLTDDVLNSLLNRQAMTHGGSLKDAKVYLYAPHLKHINRPDHASWSLERLILPATTPLSALSMLNVACDI